MAPWHWLRRQPASTLAFLATAMLFLVGSLDWRPVPPQGFPRTSVELHSAGELWAGAAKVSMDPPFPVPRGGMLVRSSEVSTGVAQPTFVRALVVEVGGKRLAMVSAELAVIPARLRQRTREAVADLHLDDLLVGATHTHTGVGGFLKPPPSIAEVGPFDARVEDFLVQQFADALHKAAGSLAPARLASATIEASNFSISLEPPPGKIDSLLTGARFWGADKAIANIVVFAAEPLIVVPSETRLHGDWPGAMMAALELDDGPPTLFFQGALGDTTWGKREGNISFADRPARFGQAVAADAKGALAAGGKGDASIRLDYAREEIALPRCESLTDWPLLHSIASNWFCWSYGLSQAGRTTSVSYLRLGAFRMAATPGKVVASLGLAWEEPLKDAAVASLVDDYVGSIGTPEAIANEVERRSVWDAYYGAELAPAVLQGIELARDRVMAPATGN